jgi:hypothetical protein
VHGRIRDVAIRTQTPTQNAASIGSAIVVKDLGKATADFQTLHHSRLPGNCDDPGAVE